MLNDPTHCVVAGLDIKPKIKSDESPTWYLRLSCPMTHDLALAMFPPMAEDLYCKVGDDWVPKAHNKRETFEVPFGGLDFDMKTHPELKSDGLIHEAQVSDVTAKKNDAGSFDFSFSVFFPEPSNKIMLFLCKRVKQGLYVTLKKNDLLTAAGPTAVPPPEEATGI